MKKLVLSLVTGLMACAAAANPYGVAQGASQLHLRMHDNSAFTLILDHRMVNQPSRGVSVPALAPGRHRVKIVKHTQGYGYGSASHIAYNGFIDVPARSEVKARLRYNRLDIVSVVPLYGYGNDYGHGYVNNGYGHGVLNTLCTVCHADPCNCQGSLVVAQPCSTCGLLDCSCNGYGHDIVQPCGTCGLGDCICSGPNGSGYGNGGYCGTQYGFNASVFDQLKYSIMNMSFDRDRLQVAKQAIAVNGATSLQIFELMELLTFESNKLELAKFAYPYTVDPQNYFVVNSGFTFSSSINSLDYYIAHH